MSYYFSEVTMATNIAVLMLFIAISSVGAQTFQYSRGWTNGKRGSFRRHDVTGPLERHDVTGLLERDDVISPVKRPLGSCQLRKLKYLLEGRPLNEKVCVNSFPSIKVFAHTNSFSRAENKIAPAYPNNI